MCSQLERDGELWGVWYVSHSVFIRFLWPRIHFNAIDEGYLALPRLDNHSRCSCAMGISMGRRGCIWNCTYLLQFLSISFDPDLILQTFTRATRYIRVETGGQYVHARVAFLWGMRRTWNCTSLIRFSSVFFDPGFILMLLKRAIRRYHGSTMFQDAHALLGYLWGGEGMDEFVRISSIFCPFLLN